MGGAVMATWVHGMFYESVLIRSSTLWFLPCTLLWLRGKPTSSLHLERPRSLPAHEKRW